MSRIKHLKKEILPILLILIFLLIGITIRPYLPAVVATHWDINSNPDGWNTKNFAVFFFPGLIFGIYLLLSLFPHIDPYKENVLKFSDVLYRFKIFFVCFLGSIYLLTLYAALNTSINISQFVMIGVAWMFYYLALMLPQLKRNFFIGIRLPWTLASDKNWDKTHKLGKKVFIILSFLVLINSFFTGRFIFWIFMSEMIISILYITIYSFLEFKKEKK